MKTLIINYNRLGLVRNFARWLSLFTEVIIVDNHSNYGPLLSWYNEGEFEVMHMDDNYGHTVVWFKNVLERAGITKGERYLVTDSDLNCEGVPGDFLEVLSKGLDRYQAYDKCGLSLRIDDLPVTREGEFIRKHEAKYWQGLLPCGEFYDAPIDTTLAMYREGVTTYNHNAIRAAPPYMARHMPWYYDKLEDLPWDEQYYYRTAGSSCSSKKRLMA